MNAIKQKIIKYMKDNNLSSASLSKQAGISSGIVHNIIKSEKPNPTIDSVLKIAKIMDCSLDELLETNSLDFNPETQNIVLPLLKSVCGYLCESKYMENKNFNDFCKISNYIYNYCLENDLKEVDNNFAKWYVSKIYS
jgi:transcriptional regulator with XRE-family HTH domain